MPDFHIGDHVRASYKRSKKSFGRTGYVAGISAHSIIVSTDDDGHDLRLPAEWLERLDTPKRSFRVVFKREAPQSSFGSLTVYAEGAQIHEIAYISHTTSVLFAFARGTKLEEEA